MGNWSTIRTTTSDDGAVLRIILARPETRNAQSRRLLAELNEAFTHAAYNDVVKVIVLAADGPHFSSGHDLRDLQKLPDDPGDVTGGHDFGPTGIRGGFEKPGAEGYLAFEEEAFFHMCRRWHDLPKPMIAEVHGKVIAGGLMLMWVCDLIIAAEGAEFSDPTVAFGVNGVEWFSHPWEVGPRKAKEMLFTGGPLSAEDARVLGMVNHVVAMQDLRSFTDDLAARIAERPSFGLRLAKMAVNQTLDAQGFWTAQQAAFSLQHLGHADIRERGTSVPMPGRQTRSDS